MHKTVQTFHLSSCSGNRKSKIQKRPRGLKWVGFLVALLMVCGAGVDAQQPKKLPMIGYLSSRDPASESARTEAVRLGLRERGYIEGQNIAIEHRYAEGNRERFPELAAELVRLKVDIIVAAGGDLLVRPVMNASKDYSHRYDGRWSRSGRGRPD